MNQSLSIIIPAFNESAGIVDSLKELFLYLKNNNCDAEVIVVNDGSTDNTLEVLKPLSGLVKIVSHPYNKGYGASVMTGIAKAKHDWVLMYDADGQHEPKYIEKLLKQTEQCDLIIGSRFTGHQGPKWRQPGKKILHFVAEYLVKHEIPDINSGMRLVRRDLMMKYFHIFPQGFSLSTTSTLAFLKDGLNVCFEPIEIRPRTKGKSTLKVHDGFNTLMLIVRLVMIFSPLRVILPATLVIFLLGLASLVYDFTQTNIGDTTVLLLVVSLILFFFGLIADQVAAIRRQIK